MIEKKIEMPRNKYCLLMLALFIVSGCASNNKRSQLSHIQQQRIFVLEQQLQKKDAIISDLKAKDWVNKPVHVPEDLALLPLRRLMKNKEWVQALKLSSKLKKDHPNSVKLASYRYQLFKKMGLNKQAMNELQRLKALRVSSQRKSSQTR